MTEISLQNIITGHGISVSLTGMAIVFSGLLIITIAISLLPRILELPNKIRSKSKGVEKADNSNELAAENSAKSVEDDQSAGTEYSEEDDIASVIAFVLQMEAEHFYRWDNEAITINRESSQPSMWGKAAKMRPVPNRRTYAKV